jgi:hypothetical protein
VRLSSTIILYLTSDDTDKKPGLSRQAIFTAVEASLARLDTPYLDLLQIHRFDANTPIEETMEALHDLVKSGKVRYIGASSMWATQFAQMQFVAEKHGWTKFVSMQNHYNLLYREEEREMNRYCDAAGVGLIPVRLSLMDLVVCILLERKSSYSNNLSNDSVHFIAFNYLLNAENWLLDRLRRNKPCFRMHIGMIPRTS